MQACPCGSKKSLSECCDIFIQGTAIPATPEELMRSRYTAYALQNINYIAQTMKSPANDDFNPQEAHAWAKQIRWLQLQIINTQIYPATGTVEFRAFYSHKNKSYALHEISEFVFENGQWFYINGTMVEADAIPTTANKVARNELCPCGSNKKYKKCCAK